MVFFKRLNKEFVITGIDILFYHSEGKYILKYDYYLKFLKNLTFLVSFTGPPPLLGPPGFAEYRGVLSFKRSNICEEGWGGEHTCLVKGFIRSTSEQRDH